MTELEINYEYPLENCITSIGGVGYSNTGAVKLDDSLIFIDTTLYPVFAAKFKKEVEARFGKEATNVVYTHYHGDHTFGSSPFSKTTIISSKETEVNIRKGFHDEWREDLEKEDPLVTGPINIIYPSITFEYNYTLELQKSEINMTRLGGHTSGSSIIYFPHQKLMFAGDIIFSESFPYGADPTADLDDWIEALKIIKSYDTRLIIPGHGPIIENRKELEGHIKFYNSMRSVILEGIEDHLNLDQIITNVQVPDLFKNGEEVRKEISVEQWYSIYLTKKSLT